MLVVDTGEDFSGDFASFEEVMQVGSRVIFTTFAVTTGHNRRKIVVVLAFADVEAAV